MDLLIRAGRQDHTVVEQLLTPPTTGLARVGSKPISALVADAHVAEERSKLGDIAAHAGCPYLIDPVTPLLQSNVAPANKWALLPFAHAEALDPRDLHDARVQDELIERVFDFQRSHGATHLIPPYLYLPKRGDEWEALNLSLLQRSVRYLSAEGIGLPVVPVFAASLAQYGPQATWKDGLDSFLKVAADLNVDRVALSYSFNDPAKAKYSHIAQLATATEHAASMVEIVSWRQGLYGLDMLALGASGYETGIETRESLHYVSLASTQKPQPPKPDKDQGGAASMLYVGQFGRSLRKQAALVLLEDPRIRGSLVCTSDGTCCPDGTASMVNKHREHAIRERAREISELAAIPDAGSWRLNHVAQRAGRAVNLARTANEILEGAGLRDRVPTDPFEAMHQVTSELLTLRNRRTA